MLKIILVLIEFEITYYLTQNFYLKEIRENNKIISIEIVYPNTMEYAYYSILDRKLSEGILDEADFNEELWTIEGKELISSEILDDSIKYLNFESIFIRRSLSIPNSMENRTSDHIFASVPDIHKYVPDVKYLRLLQLTNKSLEYDPYIIEMKQVTNYSLGPAVMKEIISIEEATLPADFLENKLPSWK